MEKSRVVKWESSPQVLTGWKMNLQSKKNNGPFLGGVKRNDNTSTAKTSSQFQSRDSRSVSPRPVGWHVGWGRLAECSKCSHSASRPFCLAPSAPHQDSPSQTLHSWIFHHKKKHFTKPWSCLGFPCLVGLQCWTWNKKRSWPQITTNTIWLSNIAMENHP